MTQNTPEEHEEKANEENTEKGSSPTWLSLLLVTGFVLIFVGALVVFASVALGGSSSSSSAGIVIFIGPIPIVFGAGPDAGLLISAAAILAATSILLFIAFRRRAETKPAQRD